MKEFSSDGELLWKVTRRIPSMSVAETETFTSKQDAIRQYENWLS